MTAVAGPRIRRLIRIVVAALAALLLGAVPASAAQSFPNTTPIAIPGSATSGPGSPYPSSVTVGGVAGPVSDVNVTLNGVSHTHPADLRLLLVAPNGRKAALMTANCGGDDIDNFTWIFDQQAAKPMPVGSSCPDVVNRPAATTSNTNLPAPAPLFPYPVSLDIFNGVNPNGEWKLFVADTSIGDVGEIKRGWTLTLTTSAVDATVPGTGSSGPANPYPAAVDVSGSPGVITDLDVSIDGIWHQRSNDLDLLLVGPQGQRVVLMSDACGTFTVEGVTWTWDDEALGAMFDDTLGCGSGLYRPSDYGQSGDSWPAPAPGGPYADTLSAFDLTDPNGQWRLYVNDDTDDKTGFVTNRFRLNMTTREKAGVAFTEDAVTLAEGGERQLTLRRPTSPDLLAGEVKVTSVPMSAASPGDFTPVSTTIQFGAGQNEKTVLIDARADGVEEPDETYAITINSATGDAQVDSPSTVAVTIPAPTPGAGNGGGPAGPGAGGAAPRCAGKRATIVGSAGRDVLRGTRRRDVIAGLGGNDVIAAARGNDTVCAGAGNDRVSGGSGRDRLSGGAGRDTCLGGPGRDRATCERST